jgi:predicted nucleic acid-binding protein
MAGEVLFDTSGFFALMDERDPAHAKAIKWIRAHLVARFLDYLEQSAA